MVVALRKASALVVSIALVVVLGVVAAWGHLSTASKVDQTQRADRLRLESTLSGLTNQYLQFVFLDTQRAAASASWRLTARDPQDRSALEQLVRTSHLTTYGAALVSTTGVPLTWYAPKGLPSPTDKGFVPLRRALLAGRPGLSDVVHAGSTPLIAFAVPVLRGAIPVALFIAYADVRVWPLQGYDTTIQLGTGAVPYVLDSSGTVTASSDPAAVGTRLTGLPAVVTNQGKGVVEAHGQVVSYVGAGQGWSTVTIQPVSSFSGALHSRTQRDAVVLVVLLTLVVALLVAFNHQRQQALRRLADERLLDPLTGLPQRRLFELRLDAAMARHRRSHQPLAVLYCDVDDFKGVNDTLGHNVGDQVLVAVGQRLAGEVREVDMVARLGGDEFAVVLEGSDAREVRRVVRRLREAVAEPLAVGGTVLHPRASIGGAVLVDPARADDLLVEADLAMYRTKRGDDAGEPVVVLDGTSRPEAAVPDGAAQRG